MARATILIRDPRYVGRGQPGPVYIPRASRRDAIVLRSSVTTRPNTVWLGFSALAIASAMFIAWNVPNMSTISTIPASQHVAAIFGPGETTVFPKTQARPKIGFDFAARWAQVRSDEGPMGPADYEEPEYTGALGFTTRVQTVSFTKQGGGGFQLASADPSVSISGIDDSISADDLAKREKIERLRQEMMTNPANQTALAKMDEVERYLWEVYTRSPIKKDGAGDFTWKDPAAAKHVGMSLPTYVISGMDPDFREQLYHAGRAMDADGIHWAILSAFRDDYRQRLASGFKASAGNSLHGGSRRVGGYGHGRAIDITSADGDMEDVWHWIDKHGGKYGLTRPMPGRDPAHIQSRGDWRAVAHNLKRDRLKTSVAKADPDGTKAAASKTGKSKRVANASK
jgi:hypothetical protein